MGRGSGVVAIFALAACGVGDAAAPDGRPYASLAGPPRDFASGSRLRARYDVIGAVEKLTSFHDSALDLECAFADDRGAFVGPGPSYHCLPIDAPRHRTGTGPYADTACTEPAVIATSDAAYAVIEPANACVTTPIVRRTLPPASLRPYSLVDGVCMRATSAAMVQRFGDEVPIDAFVSAIETVVPVAGRIEPRALLASDGATLVVGAFDKARNASAQGATDGTGTTRWIPIRLAFVNAGNERYADAACKSVLATKLAHDATCPLDAVFTFSDGCGNGTISAIGAAVPFRRHDAAGACVDDLDPAILAFEVGAVIPPGAFAKTTTTDVGEGPAQRRGLGEESGAPVAWSDVIDVGTGEACVVVDTNGVRRCLPARGELVDYFADDACTEPAFARVRTGCTNDSAARFVRDSATPRVFTITREVDAIFEAKGGACTRFTPLVDATLFAATEVPLERFPIATARAE